MNVREIVVSTSPIFFSLLALTSRAVDASQFVSHIHVDPPERGAERLFAPVRDAPAGARHHHHGALDSFIHGAPTGGHTVAKVPDSVASGGDGGAVQPAGVGFARVPPRDSRFSPDLGTTPEPQASYVEVFTPATGRKRFFAYDRVDPGGALSVRDDALAPVPLAARGPPNEFARFRAEIRVRFRAEAFVPVPSVAAGAYLTQTVVRPRMRVDFFVDSAENWFARADRDGDVMLVYAMRAPLAYFVGGISAGAAWGEIPADLAPVLPDALGDDARVVLDALRVSRGDPLADVVRRLVSYFRSFAPEESSQGEGSTYKRLALGRVGLCRHRAYAFVVTAHALGIPARFVGNEAHAWVEVFSPGTGWIAIDLGGAAQTVREFGTMDRARFVPPGPSAFPWEQGPSRVPQPSGPTMHSALASGPQPALVAASATASATATPTAPASVAVRITSPPSAPASVAATATATAPASTPLFRVDMESPSDAISRGGTFAIRARVLDSRDAPQPFAFVTIILEPVTGGVSAEVGPFQADARGRLDDAAVVPPDFALGPVRIAARVLAR